MPQLPQDFAPVISIVVPVYNAEKFLAECIESVLAQTFTNFELLLVDDGSQDASGRICDDSAECDFRIRVYHKENGGVTSARRLGVERSRGEWICFVDADDMLLPHALELLFEETKIFPEADLIEGGHVGFRGKEKRSFCSFGDNSVTDHSREPSLVLDALAYAKHIASLRRTLFDPALWGKIIRRSALLKADALAVPSDIILGEDKVTLFRLAPQIRHAVRIFSEVYVYRINDAGAVRGSDTRRRYLTPEYTLRWFVAMRAAFVGRSEEWQDVWKISVAAELPVQFLLSRGSFFKNSQLLPYFRLLSGFAGALSGNRRFKLYAVLLGLKLPFSLLPESVFRALIRMLADTARILLAVPARLRRLWQ